MLLNSYSGMMETTLVGEEWRAELLAHLTKASNMATEKVSCIRVQIAEVSVGASETGLRKVTSPGLKARRFKGMRPLYKAIRSHEEVLVRPFRDKEAALRAYLRYYQWAEIWSSQPTPVAPIAVIRERAVAEAQHLPRLSEEILRARLQSLPEKAPGASGWKQPHAQTNFPLQLSPRSPTSSGGLRLRARHLDS